MKIITRMFQITNNFEFSKTSCTISKNQTCTFTPKAFGGDPQCIPWSRKCKQLSIPKRHNQYIPWRGKQQPHAHQVDGDHMSKPNTSSSDNSISSPPEVIQQTL